MKSERLSFVLDKFENKRLEELQHKLGCKTKGECMRVLINSWWIYMMKGEKTNGDK